MSLPRVVHPCYIPVYPGADFGCSWFQQPVNRQGEHDSRVDDGLEVAVIIAHWLVVQVSQDVHPRRLLPVGGQEAGTSIWAVVGEHVVLERETLFGTICLFQQRQQLRPTGDRMITNMYW